jgi:DNA polymerase-3 subunit epsilon
MQKLNYGDLVELPKCISNKRVVILDTETTGFDRVNNRIIEFGAIWIEQNRLIMDFDQVLNPSCELPAGIVNITGITQQEVDQGPQFSSIAGFIVDLIEHPSIVIAYNSPFDMSFLRHEIERAGLKVPRIGPVIDPLRWVRHEDQGMKCSLGMAAERRGITAEGAHRALADCYITLGVLNTLHMPETLSEALELQQKIGRYNKVKK